MYTDHCSEKMYIIVNKKKNYIIVKFCLIVKNYDGITFIVG